MTIHMSKQHYLYEKAKYPSETKATGLDQLSEQAPGCGRSAPRAINARKEKAPLRGAFSLFKRKMRYRYWMSTKLALAMLPLSKPVAMMT